MEDKKISVYYDPFMNLLITKEKAEGFRFKSFCYNGSFIWFNYKLKMPDYYIFLGYI